MKKAYLITYDTKTPAEKYPAIIDILKSFPAWWHYIENSWIVITEQSAVEIFERFKPHVNNNINLLIIEVAADRSGWLPKKSWEWLKKHLQPSRH